MVICTRGALNSLPLASSQLHSQSQSESESSLTSSWLSLLLPLCCCCCKLPLSLLLLLLFIIFIVGFDSCGLPPFPASAYNLCTSGCVVFYYLELVAPFCAHSVLLPLLASSSCTCSLIIVISPYRYSSSACFFRCERFANLASKIDCAAAAAAASPDIHSQREAEEEEAAAAEEATLKKTLKESRVITF